MKEAYCSYGIAKLLKEKGFDEECFGAYTETNHNITMFTGQIRNNEYGVSMYTAPTHQMACAWLREKHRIHIYAEYKAFFQERPKELYYHWIPFIKALPNCPISGFPKNTICIHVYCDNYEDAIEEAVKYVLIKL